ELADLFGVHRSTLYRYMKKKGVSREYSTLSNHDLDILVKAFKRDKPESGLRYVVGFLRTRGIRVQKR
ncbi:hypothetical protein C8J57DRAFT_1032475, partial [Mycena rebaudengoi]